MAVYIGETDYCGPTDWEEAVSFQAWRDRHSVVPKTDDETRAAHRAWYSDYAAGGAQ